MLRQKLANRLPAKPPARIPVVGSNHPSALGFTENLGILMGSHLVDLIHFRGSKFKLETHHESSFPATSPEKARPSDVDSR